MIYSGGLDNWYSLCIKDITCDIEFSTRPVRKLSFQDAADYTAVEIAKKFSNLYVLMSGGLDSEFVASVLYRNNILFTPIVASIPKVLDHFYALNWCQERNIEPVFFEFKQNDPRLIGQVCKNWQEYNFNSEAAAVVTFLLDYVKENNGNAITGEPALTTVSTNFYEQVGDNLSIGAIHLLPTLATAPTMPGGFLMYTPEILLAAASELDTTKNDAQARAKLYNVPYRPKIAKMPSHIDESITSMLKAKHPTIIDNSLECRWTREQFINKFDIIE